MTAMKDAGRMRFANMEMWSGSGVVLKCEACGGSEAKLTCAKVRTKIGKNMSGELDRMERRVVKRRENGRRNERGSEEHWRFSSAVMANDFGKDELNAMDSMSCRVELSNVSWPPSSLMRPQPPVLS